MNKKVVGGLEFGNALVKHLGLEAGCVSQDIVLHAGRDKIFSVTLNHTLNGDDLIAIGNIMNGESEQHVGVRGSTDRVFYKDKYFKVPEWAKWIAADYDGSVFAFEDKPTTKEYDEGSVYEPERHSGKWDFVGNVEPATPKNPLQAIY